MTNTCGQSSVIPFPLLISHNISPDDHWWHHTPCVMSPPPPQEGCQRLRSRVSGPGPRLWPSHRPSLAAPGTRSHLRPPSRSRRIFSPGPGWLLSRHQADPFHLRPSRSRFFQVPALISNPRLAVDAYYSRVPDDYRADTRQPPGPGLTDRVMGNLCINSSSNHGPWSRADLIQTSGAISDVAEIIRQLVVLLSSSSSQPAEHPASWMQGRGNTCAYKKAENIGPNRIAKIPHLHFRFYDRLSFNVILRIWIICRLVPFQATSFSVLVSFAFLILFYNYLIIKTCWLKIIRRGLTCDENGIIRRREANSALSTEGVQRHPENSIPQFISVSWEIGLRLELSMSWEYFKKFSM